MLFLAIETSSTRGSLALFSGQECLKESLFAEGLIHGRELTVHLESMLAAEGRRARELQAISVSLGPGSYTGLRVGVTAAKTLGFVLRLPVVTESSLRVIAGNCLEPSRESASAPPHVLVVLNARQDFLYAALFEIGARGHAERVDEGARSGTAGGNGPGLPTRLLEDSVGTAGEIVRRLEAALLTLTPSSGSGAPIADPSHRHGLPQVWVLGDGADLFLRRLSVMRASPATHQPETPPQSAEKPQGKDLNGAQAETAAEQSILRFLPVRGPHEYDVPLARVLGRLTATLVPAARFDLETIHRLEPLYLRRTEAERRLSTPQDT